MKNGCRYCGDKYYVKRIRYAAPLLAPLTKAEELRQALINLTGEEFCEIEVLYCPVCGKKLKNDGDKS